MASEKQIVANRRNSRKSTGPKSHAGKKRAARNAFTHGLSVSFRSAASDALVDDLAVEIAGGIGKDPRVLHCARSFAQAEQELDRIRRLRIGLIEGPAPGRADLGSGSKKARAKQTRRETAENVSAPQARQAHDAIRRALPDLARCVRYERRAAAARDKAFNELLRVMRQLNNDDPMPTSNAKW